MQELVDYVLEHAVRGDCQCGRCLDAPDVKQQPAGHTADLIFFKVAAKDGDADKLKKLVEDNKTGEFNNVDMFDGNEHGYMEVGGWIGSQDLALQLMGLGAVLGIWHLLTPKIVIPNCPDDKAMELAGSGMVAVIYKKPRPKPVMHQLVLTDDGYFGIVTGENTVALGNGTEEVLTPDRMARLKGFPINLQQPTGAPAVFLEMYEGRLPSQLEKKSEAATATEQVLAT
jgi:hypothetical protein